ncbi:MAG TPA: SpoIIE family protein phosphatase [Gemmataceae bacterium]|jgi:sigma-B regulation protein RsbU (phosphoserine phosphatase)
MTTGPGSLLVVDDNPVAGEFLARILGDAGHAVTVCPDGRRALDLAAADTFDLVLLDIGLPGPDGLSVLRDLRAGRAATELPVIMATADGHSDTVVRALGLGANDYVVKPYDVPVLLARVRTHLAVKRLVEDMRRLEDGLARRNEELRDVTRRLADANRRMKADLHAAARVQEGLLPPPEPALPGAKFAWLSRPCEELAGDTLNVVRLDDDHVGLYLLDASGHGVAAALLAVRVHQVLTPVRELSTALVRPGGPVPPAEVARHLGRLFPLSEDAPQFFTLAYAVLNRRTGRLRYVAAGHPGPVHVPAGGPAGALPESGPPVGLGGEYQEQGMGLRPGDRVYLYSDGVTEAAADGELYGQDRLVAAAGRARGLPLADSLAAVLADVEAWRGGPARDDVSLLAVEYTGEAGR